MQATKRNRNWLKPPRMLLRRKLTLGKIFLLNAIFIFGVILYLGGFRPTVRDLLNSELHIPIDNDLLFLKGNSTRVPRILFWTEYFTEFNFTPLEITPEVFQGCSANCLFTFNKKQLKDADALIFHARDLAINKLPQVRSPEQIWIYFLLESPIHTHFDLTGLPGVFNWTMTYRSDSDIYHPYARAVPLQVPLKSPNLTWPYSQKRKVTIAWTVSNCKTPSRRENYIAELTQHIPIDVYGKCIGGIPCPGNISSCYSELARRGYKFYLAFENSLCSDYVTEKFWEPLKAGLVPIVYSGANYSLFAPPGSYINSRNFRNPKHLAKYLKFLDDNPEEYAKYFVWKKYYEILPSRGWCDLCDKLSKPPSERKHKIYKDLHSWWNYIKVNETTPTLACESVQTDNILLELIRYLRGWN